MKFSFDIHYSLFDILRFKKSSQTKENGGQAFLIDVKLLYLLVISLRPGSTAFFLQKVTKVLSF